jgi:hypothetical protein
MTNDFLTTLSRRKQQAAGAGGRALTNSNDFYGHERVQTREVQAQRKDGTVFPVQILVNPVLDVEGKRECAA